MPPPRFETLRYPLSGAAVFFLEEGRGGPKPAEGTHTSGHAGRELRASARRRLRPARPLARSIPVAGQARSRAVGLRRIVATLRPGAAAGCCGLAKAANSELNNHAGHAWARIPIRAAACGVRVRSGPHGPNGPILTRDTPPFSSRIEVFRAIKPRQPSFFE